MISSYDCVNYSVTNISVSNETSINRLKYIITKQVYLFGIAFQY